MLAPDRSTVPALAEPMVILEPPVMTPEKVVVLALVRLASVRLLFRAMVPVKVLLLVWHLKFYHITLLNLLMPV